MTKSCMHEYSKMRKQEEKIKESLIYFFINLSAIFPQLRDGDQEKIKDK